MKVYNLPTNYTSYEWLAVTECEGRTWFYGGWRTDLRAALEQADEIENGHVVNSAVVKPAEF